MKDQPDVEAPVIVDPSAPKLEVRVDSFPTGAHLHVTYGNEYVGMLTYQYAGTAEAIALLTTAFGQYMEKILQKRANLETDVRKALRGNA